MRLHLFLHVAGMEARRRMSYRADFWINALISFAVEFGIVWFLWKALYAESGTQTLAGFNFEQVLVYYVAVILSARLVRGTDFEADLSQDIYDGGLNRYLVLPTPYIVFKYAQHLGALLPALLQIALFGTLWWLVAGDRGAEGITLGGALMCAASLVLANLLYYLMRLPLHAVAFWADNVWSLIVGVRLVTGLLGGLLFPLALFPDSVQSVNAWLPFRCFFALPAEALLGRVSFEAWLHATAVGCLWLVIFAAAGRAVWRRGMLQYSGIGM